jgi:hypothetical protein
MIDTIKIVTIEYSMDDPCADTTNTFYSFDNSKGEYYCYVMRDEDIPITKEWIVAHDEYWKKSQTKVIVEEGNCN